MRCTSITNAFLKHICIYTLAAIAALALMPVQSMGADNIGSLVNASFQTSWTYRSGGVTSPPGGWVLAGWAASAGGPQYYNGTAELYNGRPTDDRCKWEFSSGGIGGNNVIAKEVNWGTYTSVTVTVYCAGRYWSGGAAGTMSLGIDTNGSGTQWSDCGTNTVSRTSKDGTWATISKTVSKPGGATTFTVMLNAVPVDTKWNCQFDELTITGSGGGTTGILNGNVKDGAGANVSGATVSTNTGGYTTTTDANGNYTITNVTAGTYNVTASKSGYNSQTQSNKTVTANQTTTVNFTITRQTGTIAGNVKDSVGQSLSGATVSTNTGGYTTTTDASGNYTLSNVATGTYNVTASKTGYNSQAQNNQTVSNNTTTTVNFTCTHQTGTITGNVKNSSGTNISGATVSTSTGGYTTFTDANGNYTLSNVDTGTYDVTASKSGYTTSTQTGKTVSTNATTTVNFTLTSSSNLLVNPGFEGGFTSGLANNWTSWVSSWSNPITFADETSIIHGGAHAQKWGRSDRLKVHGGVCQRINVTSGHTYRISSYLRFSATDTGAWCEMGYDLTGQTTNGEATTVNYTKLESGGQNVWLSYSRDVTTTGSTLSVFCKFGQYNEGGSGPSWCYADDLSVTDLTGSSVGTLTGNVKNSSNQNISGATVSTSSGGYTTTTDASGNYTITNVAEGAYNVTASKSGYISQTKSATVTTGQTTTTNFTLSTSGGTGAITGKVKSPTNVAISGATVTTSPATSTATTDANGNYTISGIAAGTYSVSAAKTGYQTHAWESISVVASATTTVPDNYLPRSSSKIGAHVVIGRRDGWSTFLTDTHNAGKGCALVKCLDDFGAAYDAKQISPETLTVGRLNEAPQGYDLQGMDYAINDDPAVTAQNVFNDIHPRWDLNPQIDVWEIFNEWSAHWDWQADFLIAMMDIAEANGHRVALFGCSAGNPPEDAWPDIARACARAKAHGGHMLSLHEYSWTTTLQQDYANEGALLVTRYRSLYTYLKQNNADCPLVLTEVGNNGGGGYIGDTAFVNDMGWYDNMCRQDSYVMGIASWTLGEWSGANWYTALPEMATYIIAN